MLSISGHWYRSLCFRHNQSFASRKDISKLPRFPIWLGNTKRWKWTFMIRFATSLQTPYYKVFRSHFICRGMFNREMCNTWWHHHKETKLSLYSNSATCVATVFTGDSSEVRKAIQIEIATLHMLGLRLRGIWAGKTAVQVRTHIGIAFSISKTRFNYSILHTRAVAIPWWADVVRVGFQRYAVS